jgi:transposase
LGRSRGGLSTKVHLVADTRCRPVSRVLTGGNRHDSVAFEFVMKGIRIGRRGPGRPRTRPDRVLADKAYSNRVIRLGLRRRGIKVTIPEPADQIANRVRRGSRGGRPPAFDTGQYRQRNTVERTFSKLKAARSFGTRYDKRQYVFEGTVDVATIRIWLKDLTRDLRDTP